MGTASETTVLGVVRVRDELLNLDIPTAPQFLLDPRYENLDSGKQRQRSDYLFEVLTSGTLLIKLKQEMTISLYSPIRESYNF